MANVSEILTATKKEFGVGVVSKGIKLEDVERIYTGVFAFDLATCGIPRGRITVLYGAPSCLAADTFIAYAIRTEDGKKATQKGCSLLRLYRKFHNLPLLGWDCVQRKQTINSDYFVQSVNEGGRILMNEIEDVVFTGSKECYLLTTKSGNQITATKEHGFYVREGVFKQLGDLSPGDTVFLHNNTYYHREYHNDDKCCRAVPSEVVSIVPAGSRMTFDICCKAPYNNFVANGIVVHNSSKTTLSLKAIASMQKHHPELQNVFVDVEASYSPDWAEQLGVDNEKLIYVLPDYAEQAVDLVEAFLNADDIGVVVVDSLAALVSTNEINSSAEKAVVGGTALIVNKLYRKATHAMAASRREGRCPTLIAINQTRSKISSAMYGDPETLPGGVAFKFGASLIVRVYGKDEMDKTVSLNLPAWKLVSGIVKKWKMPIFASVFEAKIASIPVPSMGLAAGMSDDWKTVFSYIKQLGLLEKGDPKGWVLLGETYDTQQQIKELFITDLVFAEELKQAVIAKAMLGQVKVEAVGEDCN